MWRQISNLAEHLVTKVGSGLRSFSQVNSTSCRPTSTFTIRDLGEENDRCYRSTAYNTMSGLCGALTALLPVLSSLGRGKIRFALMLVPTV